MSNPVVHFEIGCRDKAVTEEFYSKLFDSKMAGMGPATMIDTGGAGIGGHITSLGHEPHHYTHFYVNGGRPASSAGQGERVGRQDVGAASGDSYGKLRLVCRSGRQHGRDFQTAIRLGVSRPRPRLLRPASLPGLLTGGVSPVWRSSATYPNVSPRASGTITCPPGLRRQCRGTLPTGATDSGNSKGDPLCTAGARGCPISARRSRPSIAGCHRART